MVEGVQQGPVLVGTFPMVAEEYLPPTAALGTWPLMSPAQGSPRRKMSLNYALDILM